MADAFSLQGKLGLDASKFRKETQKAADDLEDLDDRLEEDRELTVDTSKAEQSLDDLGSSGSGVGDMLGSGIAQGFAAVGVGAVIADSMNRAMDIEQGMANVEAQFGLTAEQAEEYGELGGNLYANAWGESMEETTAAIATVGRELVDTGHVAEDAVEGITEQAFALAQTFGEDVDAVIRSVTQLMLNGLAPDAQTAMDLVTVAFQEGGDKAGDLLDTIDEYSQHWAAFGISADEAFGVITAGFDAGFRDADKLADAIKEMRIRTVEDSDAISDAYAELGLDADTYREKILAGGDSAREAFGDIIRALDQVEDPTRQNALAVELIGTQYEDLGPKAIEVLAGIDEGLGDVQGSAEELADTVGGTAAASFEELKREITTNMGEAAMPIMNMLVMLTDIAELDFSSAGQSFKDAFSAEGVKDSVLGRMFFGGDVAIDFAGNAASGLWNFVSGAEAAVEAADPLARSMESTMVAFDAAAQAQERSRLATQNMSESSILAAERQRHMALAADSTAAATGRYQAAADAAQTGNDKLTGGFERLRSKITSVQAAHTQMHSAIRTSADASLNAEQASRDLDDALQLARESTADMGAAADDGSRKMKNWTDEELAAYDQALRTADAITDKKVATREAAGQTVTAEQRTQLYNSTLQRLASTANGPVAAALSNITNRLNAIPRVIPIDVNVRYNVLNSPPAGVPSVAGSGSSYRSSTTSYSSTTNNSVTVNNSGGGGNSVSDLDRALARAGMFS